MKYLVLLLALLSCSCVVSGTYKWSEPATEPDSEPVFDPPLRMKPDYELPKRVIWV